MYLSPLKDSAVAAGTDKTDFSYSFLPGVLFMAMLWLIHVLTYLTDASIAWLGVLPRNFFGLIGIVASPLIHADLLHLLSNSFPLVLLAGFIFYLHRSVALRVLGTIYLGSGLLTWLLGRSSYHIGASGLVYGMAGYLLFNGFLKQNRGAMAVSLAVLFLYGGLFYGLFPAEERISWEGHVGGLIAGFVAALLFGEKTEAIKKKEAIVLQTDVVQKHLSHTLGSHHQYFHIAYTVQKPKPAAIVSHTYKLGPATNTFPLSTGPQVAQR
ncbi:rhomboid family intramembrane serine protease [Pontibacter arcticus]|uniref:Rhomboid family intramembrane serine protease n=1 Tax=Pontibacter arcticus TaxID=2080288 RepID=A0A364RBW9_9BACT|nr:rhomboid family intramembrane serine protease [Pontibacter arcticus]RAU81757.1 rhomboid family intramembrane serine protease [Pontibacter arcticus]